jgi:hypothetical protein
MQESTRYQFNSPQSITTFHDEVLPSTTFHEEVFPYDRVDIETSTYGVVLFAESSERDQSRLTLTIQFELVAVQQH